MSYNMVIVEGYISKDAELRFTPAAKPVCQFSIPVDSGFGENKETVWVNCSLWDTRGEKLAPMLTKGTRVLVTGRLNPVHVYKNKEDKYVGNIQMTVADVAFTGSKQQGQQQGEGGGEYF